jgi:iron complex outermembrane receptor protein
MTQKDRLNFRTSALALVVPLLAVAGASSAAAQDVAGDAKTAPQADTSAPAEGEIVVTARRRSEVLSRVPIAVTSLGGGDLETRSITSQADLQRGVPGLTVRSGQSDSVLNFSIRGQGIDNYSASQASVASYFNEVPFASLSASNFYDLESIQVLKGPQGTLFGRNTTGGAVLYTSAKPKDEFEGYVSAGFGNYNDLRLEAAVNLPLAGEKVILRLAGNAQWRDGWQKNVTTGQKQGRVDRQSVRATLALKPTDGFSTTFVGGYSSLRGSNVGLQTYAVNACGSTNNGIALGSAAACTYGPVGLGTALYEIYRAATPGATANGIVDQVAIQKALGTRKVNGTALSAKRGEDWFIMNTSTLELGGDTSLKSIIAYTESKDHNLWDPFGTGPYVVARLFSTPDGEAGTVTGLDQSIKQFSQELQLSGATADGAIKYNVGGFYSRRTDNFYAPFAFFDVRPLFGPFISANDYQNISQSKALFAQATYDLSSAGLAGLKVTGGFRYTWEKAGLDTLARATQSGDKRERASFSAPSWTIGLDWQATDQLLLYVAQRGSFRSGGFNGSGPLFNATAEFVGNKFLPEKVRDVELGAKFSGRLGAMPLRANLAIYDSRISNVQRAQFVVNPNDGQIAALTVNIPKARVKGVEFDTNLEPVEGLEIGGNIAYTDARYTNGASNVFGQIYNYGPYADTPKWAGSAFAKVTVPVGADLGEVSMRGEVYAQSPQYLSNLANTVAPGTKFANYALVNASLDWKDVMGQPFDLSFYIKNAFQKGYYTGGFFFPPLGLASAIPGQPRMFGMTAKYRF